MRSAKLIKPVFRFPERVSAPKLLVLGGISPAVIIFGNNLN